MVEHNNIIKGRIVIVLIKINRIVYFYNIS